MRSPGTLLARLGGPAGVRAGVMLCVAGMALDAACAGMAHAQSINTETFQTIVPFGYDRGRNQSVEERPRPEFDPIGYNIGGFTLLPSVSLSAGFTDNVFEATAKTSDGFVALAPSVFARSNWSVHSLQLYANGRFLRYLNQPGRNENRWIVGTAGRLDFSADGSASLGARTARLFENQFSGVGIGAVRSSRPVQATTVSAQVDYKFTRVRTVLAADYSDFNYLPVRTFANTILDQDNRDRSVARVIGHAEYGISPDVGAFVQVGYADTDYRRLLAPGVANRDSHQIRALAGATLDLTALLRGSIGVGYVDTHYDSPLYRDLHGFSLDGKLEYFPTRLTSVTLVVSRDIEDSAVTATSGYFNNSAGLRIDHELLRNMILNAGVDYEHDSYRGIDASTDIVRFSGGAKYFVSRTFRLDGILSYNKRSTDIILLGPSIDEFRAVVGLTVRR